MIWLPRASAGRNAKRLLCGLILSIAWFGGAEMGACKGTPSDVTGVADPQTYLQEIVSELQKKWPKNRTITIVFHGHSVPTGYFRTGQVRPFDSYPHLSHVALQKRYPTSVIEIIRTGIGGENSVKGAQRFEKDVLAKNPDVVAIDYSLNDRHLGLEQPRKAWESMILQAKEAGVKVILLTPTADQRAKLNDPSDPLTQHAEQVRALAAKNGVALADSYDVFQRYVADGKQLGPVMSQGNHPNRKGHEMVVPMITKWFFEPAKVLPATARTASPNKVSH
ncbi:MAG: GDSL-type esterase/lipase family protein [Lacipirellulaceae bacterium]